MTAPQVGGLEWDSSESLRAVLDDLPWTEVTYQDATGATQVLLLLCPLCAAGVPAALPQARVDHVDFHVHLIEMFEGMMADPEEPA